MGCAALPERTEETRSTKLTKRSEMKKQIVSNQYVPKSQMHERYEEDAQEDH